MFVENKVILVTGASQGIGREVAQQLAKMNAKVVFASRSIDRLQKEADIAGNESLAIQMDITNDQSIESAIKKIYDHYGRIDILINNAGYNGNLNYWLNTDKNEENEIFNTHVLGTLRVTRAVAKIMAKQKSGLIINFASIVGWIPMPGCAAYSAAKSAIVSFTQALHEEFKPLGIDVRLFAPAHTDLGFPIQRPVTDTAETVARTLIQTIEKDKVIHISNGLLAFLNRHMPNKTKKIMNHTGINALNILGLSSDK